MKPYCPKGDSDLVDLGEGFFLAKFSLPNDVTCVLEEGP